MQFTRILKEPLLHFLAVALGIFLVFDLIKPDPDESLSKTITVHQSDLVNFMQYRAKAFSPNAVRESYDLLSPQERMQLIEDFVREEALYREAMRLNLDQNDYLQRLKLIQKLEFTLAGLAENLVRPDRAEVEEYYKLHKSSYMEPGKITFAHVFFSNERHGAESAEVLADQTLAQLNLGNVPFHQATAYGDRFLYNVNYVRQDIGYVSSHFGAEMAEKLFQLNAEDRRWRGSFISPHGVHLVLVTELSVENTPPLEDIFDRVEADVIRASQEGEVDQAIKRIIATYDVRLSDDFSNPSGVTGR